MHHASPIVYEFITNGCNIGQVPCIPAFGAAHNFRLRIGLKGFYTQATLLEQQGQAEEAAEAYRESIAQLKKSPEHTPEVRIVPCLLRVQPLFGSMMLPAHHSEANFPLCATISCVGYPASFMVGAQHSVALGNCTHYGLLRQSCEAPRRHLQLLLLCSCGVMSVHNRDGRHHEVVALQVVQAMAVSLNKLGDRQYLGKDLHGAMQYYKEALRVRQDSCKGAEAVPAEALLGLVTSLLKVVDIEQVYLHHLRAYALRACCS